MFRVPVRSAAHNLPPHDAIFEVWTTKVTFVKLLKPKKKKKKEKDTQRNETVFWIFLCQSKNLDKIYRPPRQ